MLIIMFSFCCRTLTNIVSVVDSDSQVDFFASTTPCLTKTNNCLYFYIALAVVDHNAQFLHCGNQTITAEKYLIYRGFNYVCLPKDCIVVTVKELLESVFV